MTKAERLKLRTISTPAITYDEQQIVKLLNAIDEKDALIVELIDLAYNGFGDIDCGNSRRQHQMALDTLKARAAQ